MLESSSSRSEEKADGSMEGRVAVAGVGGSLQGGGVGMEEDGAVEDWGVAGPTGPVQREGVACGVAWGSFHAITWVLIAVMAFVVGIVLFFSPVTIFALPIIVGAPVLFFWVFYTCRLRRHPSMSQGQLDEQVIRQYAGGFVPGALCAFVVESILVLIFTLLVFPDVTAKTIGELLRGEDASTSGEDLLKEHLAQVIVFQILNAYIVAGLVEESVKAIMVRFVCCFWTRNEAVCVQPQPTHVRATMAMLLGVALGFSTVENFEYVMASPNIVVAIVESLIRSAISMPLHATAAGFTAVEFGFRDMRFRDGEDIPWWDLLRVIAPAVLVHGTFDACAFLIPIFVQDQLVASGIELGVAVAVLAISLFFLNARWKQVVAKEDSYFIAQGEGDRNLLRPMQQETHTIVSPLG